MYGKIIAHMHGTLLFTLPQLTLPDNIRSMRWGHSMTDISLARGLTEVTMFGGSTFIYNYDYVAATTVMTFGEF